MIFGPAGSQDKKTKFVTVPLHLVTHIERIGPRELQLVTPNETLKLRLLAGMPQSTMQRWFDHLVVKIDDMGVAAPPPTPLHGEYDEQEAHEHEHPAWYKMPDDESGNLAKIFHVLTFPLKAAVFATTPDVLIPANEKYYLVTIVMSMIWLAVLAILMTDIIEYIGCGLGVDGTVMGLSLGAIGTSFPNFYASILVAKAGQGGMAICQAIAANTFNICICLGLLWLLHTTGLGYCDYGSHGAHFGPCGGCYAPSGFKPLCPFWQGTNNHFGRAPGSTKGAILVSLLWMVFFTATLVVNRMRIGKPAAMAMFGMYAGYIGYQCLTAFGIIPPFLCFSSLNICI